MFNKERIDALEVRIAGVSSNVDLLIEAMQKEPSTADTLKSLIVFAKEMGIPHFKYEGFEFNLSAPNPNQSLLEKMQAEVKEMRDVVAGLALKEGFRTPAPLIKRAQNT
jgi:hypothetical protein